MSYPAKRMNSVLEKEVQKKDRGDALFVFWSPGCLSVFHPAFS